MNFNTTCNICSRQNNGKYSTCCQLCQKHQHTPECNERNICNTCTRQKNGKHSTCCQLCQKGQHTPECNNRNTKNITVITRNIGPKDKNIIIDSQKAVDEIIVSCSNFDILLIQEANIKNINVKSNFHMISVPYNYKNVSTNKTMPKWLPTLWLLIIINKNTLPGPISSNYISQPFAEESSNQKFTNLACITVEVGHKKIHIVNVHLKGGSCGYFYKQHFISTIIYFINKNFNKEDAVIIAGDFNIDFCKSKSKNINYGLADLNNDGFKDDPDISQTHGEEKVDHIFTRNLENKDCMTIPVEQNSVFDHATKIANYSFIC